MTIDRDALELQQLMWKPTGELRWRRPQGATDTEKILEQLHERITGERAWHPVPTLLED